MTNSKMEDFKKLVRQKEAEARKLEETTLRLRELQLQAGNASNESPERSSRCAENVENQRTINLSAVRQDDSLVVTNESTRTTQVNCHLLSKSIIEECAMKVAIHICSRDAAKKIDVGTQTFVTQSSKTMRTSGCANCDSTTHSLRACSKPFNLGFCYDCAANGFDAADCVFPHGIEHEISLGKCYGCSQDKSLFTPECLDCNERYAYLVPWLRAKYATLHSDHIPKDHLWLVNEGTSTLKKFMQQDFLNPRDKYNIVRKFLIEKQALRDLDIDGVVEPNEQHNANKFDVPKNALMQVKRIAAASDVIKFIDDFKVDEIVVEQDAQE